MSNVLSLTITHQQAKLGSFQLRFEAGKYQLFNGQQIIELADRASLCFGDLTITVCHNQEVNSYKSYRYISEPDPVLARLRELSHTHTAPDSLEFLKSQELPLTSTTGQAKMVSSGNILCDLGFL